MAFFKGSYYENLKQFEEDADGNAFRGPRARPIANPEAVLEHAVTSNDRLDALGQHYYANSRDWRRLADCNPEALFAEDLIVTPFAFPQPDEVAEAEVEPLTLDDTTNQRIGRVVLVPRRKESR